MNTQNTTTIKHILCPSDLSGKAQKALGYATKIAEAVNAELTACHCMPANWFSPDISRPIDRTNQIRDELKKEITGCQERTSLLRWRSSVIESSFDPARDILNLARETSVDLVVMKARPSVLSAFRFGSIVERVVTAAPCPVLLFPSQYLANRDPKVDDLEIRRILFDHDFSMTSKELLHVASDLSRGYDADLHVLTVLEPQSASSTEAATFASSRTSLQTLVREQLGDAIRIETGAKDVTAVVEWGKHAETVLEYAKDHSIDLICTTLKAPHFYFEKLYSAYLGNLLRSATCPILVRQAEK